MRTCEPGAGVEGGERFVEQQQPGLGGERAGQGDALGLAAGERPGLGAGVRRRGRTARATRGARSRALGLVVAAGAEAEGDVVERGEPGEQQVVLEHDADGALGGRDERVGGGVVEHGAVERRCGRASRGCEPGDGAQRGGLAGAVGPEQGDDLAVADLEVDVEVEVAERGPRWRRRQHRVRRPASGRGAGSSTASDTAMSTSDRAMAASRSDSRARNTARGMVWVRPWRLPAKVTVAPNSPRARAQHSTAPAMIDGAACGRVTRRKTVHRLAPSVAAASS